MLKFTFNGIAALALLSARSTLACSTCGFADNSTPYFFKMVMFMTALPVAFLGFGVFYLRKKGAEKNARDDQ